MSARLGWVFAIWRDQISRSFPHGRTRKFTFQSLFYAFYVGRMLYTIIFFFEAKKNKQNKTRQGRREGGREGASIEKDEGTVGKNLSELIHFQW